MHGRVLGGGFNHHHTQHTGFDQQGPGNSAFAPGHLKKGGTGEQPAVGQGAQGAQGAQGEQGTRDHTPAQVQQQISNYVPPQRAEQVELKPGKSGPKTAPPDVTGRKGPAGNDAYVSQFNPAGATATNYPNGDANCGPAVAAMVASNPSIGYGKGMTQAELVNDLGQVGGTTAAGTSGNGVIAMYEHMGLDTNATAGADMNWINAELQAGHHVTAMGDFYEVPNRVDTGMTSGHYIDVTSLTKSGDYTVLDPADSKVTSMTAAQLQNFITSAPGGGFAISAWKPTGAAAAPA